MANSTYSVCESCRRLNRVSLQAGSTKRPICGNCKNDLPIRGGVNELTAAALEALIVNAPVPVVTDFWAPWCGPCRTFSPTFIQAAQSMAGEFVFAKIDTQAHEHAAAAHGIRSIPTLIIFEGGRERARMQGALPLAPFMEWLRKQRSSLSQPA